MVLACGMHATAQVSAQSWLNHSTTAEPDTNKVCLACEASVSEMILWHCRPQTCR